MSWGVGRRRGLDPVLLWLCCGSAVSLADGYSSDSTPSVGTSIHRGSGPRKGKKTKKKKKKKRVRGGRLEDRTVVSLLYLQPLEQHMTQRDQMPMSKQVNG